MCYSASKILAQILQYYSENTQSFAEQTFNIDMKNVYEPYLQALPMYSRTILDIGCGSGRDAIYFAQLGYQVTAIDASQALIDWAKQHDENHLVNWQCLTFESLPMTTWQNQFDGIWACAALLHVPFDRLHVLFANLENCLNVNGILYASFKYGKDERQENGRFFCDMDENRWQQITRNLGFSTIKIWQTTDNCSRNAQIWFNVLVQKN